MATYLSPRAKRTFPHYPISSTLITLRQVISEISIADPESYKYMLRLEAIINDDVNFLKELADDTDWVNFQDPTTGNTFLHVAIKHSKYLVCEYLSLLSDFRWDQKNHAGKTVLNLALECRCCDRTACNIVRNGASLDCVDLECGDSLLHHTIRKSFPELSKLLMEMGHDVDAVNDAQETPLWTCILHTIVRFVDELVLALLNYGADYNKNSFHGCSPFEHLLLFPKLSEATVEFFYYYSIDKYTMEERYIDPLMYLAHKKHPWFYQLAECVEAAFVGDTTRLCYSYIYSMEVEYLVVLIEKFPEAIREIICDFNPGYDLVMNDKGVRNLAILLESELREDVIEVITKLNEGYLQIENLHGSINRRSDLQIHSRVSESHFMGNLCFLLSYGCVVNASLLQRIFKKYGHGDLIQILRHMEVEMKYILSGIDPLLLVLFHKPFNLDTLFETHRDVAIFVSLSQYYSFYRYQHRLNILPRVMPKLTELARDVFRIYCSEYFKAESSKQFCMLLDKLKIARQHKEIISLQTTLYDYEMPVLYEYM